MFGGGEGREGGRFDSGLREKIERSGCGDGAMGIEAFQKREGGDFGRIDVENGGIGNGVICGEDGDNETGGAENGDGKRKEGTESQADGDEEEDDRRRDEESSEKVFGEGASGAQKEETLPRLKENGGGAGAAGIGEGKVDLRSIYKGGGRDREDHFARRKICNWKSELGGGRI